MSERKRLLVPASLSPCCHAHSHSRTLAVTQHASLLIRFCRIAKPRRCPLRVPALRSLSPRGPFNHLYWRINLHFPLGGGGARWGKKTLNLNGLVGNPTSSSPAQPAGRENQRLHSGGLCGAPADPLQLRSANERQFAHSVPSKNKADVFSRYAGKQEHGALISLPGRNPATVLKM